MRIPKSCLCLVMVLVALCDASAFVAGGTGPHYLVANDDVPPALATSLTFYTVGADGLLTIKAKVLTGRGGIAGGYFGAQRVNVLDDGKTECVYASQAAGGDIVGIVVQTLRIGNSATGSKKDTGASNGIGLAMNAHYLYASFTDANTIGTFQVKPGCKLSFVGDITVAGLQGGIIDGMAIHGNMLVVTYDDGSIESFNTSVGVPVSNGDEQNSTASRSGNTFANGVDITQDGRFAIFGDTATSTVVEVSNISSGKLTPTVVAQAQPVREMNNPPAAINSPSIAVAEADEIGSSLQQLSEAEGQALVAEMSLRLPEHREAGVAELESITADPKRDNVIARRALAWDHLQKREFNSAVEELGKGAELNARDPWLHYYLALVRQTKAKALSSAIEGLPNMMQDLRLVLDWSPEFAEARAMLAMAQLEGGGINAAMESMRVAIRLSPRNQMYLLDMAQIYMAGKHWEAATALLERLKNSPDQPLAKSAHEQLEGLPMLKKYGVMPQSATKTDIASAIPSPPAHSSTSTSASPSSVTSSRQDEDSRPDQPSSTEDADQPPAPFQPDRRPIQHLKGTLLSVDCSHAPIALLTVSAGMRVLKLRTENYQSIMIIGADEFSCTWSNRTVAVNYRAGGKADGDLSSLELQ